MRYLTSINKFTICLTREDFAVGHKIRLSTILQWHSVSYLSNKVFFSMSNRSCFCVSFTKLSSLDFSRIAVYLIKCEVLLT